MLLHYTENPELIITESINNVSGSELISVDNKWSTTEHFHNLIESSVKASNLNVKYKSGADEPPPFSFAEEVVAKCPLYSNLLVSLGYRSILFVQYFRAGYELNWLVPGEKFNTANYNVMFHFIPMLMKYWPYTTKVSTTSSDNNKFKFIMNELYFKFEVNGYNMGTQYELGNPVTFVDAPVRKYDAVVLLGVPNKEGIEAKSLRDSWQPFCNPGFDLIHMNANGSQISGDKIDITDKIQIVFSNRVDSDPIAREIGCGDEMQLMEKSVSVF